MLVFLISLPVGAEDGHAMLDREAEKQLQQLQLQTVKSSYRLLGNIYFSLRETVHGKEATAPSTLLFLP